MDWTIVVHGRPDLDAITGIWLLKKFGKEKFPGIAKARIEFLENGGELPEEKSADELEKEGIIYVDCGRGRFDHHPAAEYPEDCAATLIAKYLEIDDDPTLETILRFVVNNDLKGQSHPFDLAYTIKLMHGHHPNEPEQVISWAIEALEAKYHDQLLFFSSTREEYERKAEIDEVTITNGRVLKVVTGVSDNETFSKYARFWEAAVVIQKRSSRNVQIFTNQKHGLTLYDVTQMVRLEEAKAKGVAITNNWKILASEGRVKGAEEWYFDYRLQALLNGSLTSPNVPPTKLLLERIRELVKLGINYTYFPNDACANGRCIQRQCPYYWYGLHRCRKLRYEALLTNS